MLSDNSTGVNIWVPVRGSGKVSRYFLNLCTDMPCFGFGRGVEKGGEETVCSCHCIGITFISMSVKR